jgi:hypothetical protein
MEITFENNLLLFFCDFRAAGQAEMSALTGAPSEPKLKPAAGHERNHRKVRQQNGFPSTFLGPQQ